MLRSAIVNHSTCMRGNRKHACASVTDISKSCPFSEIHHSLVNVVGIVSETATANQGFSNLGTADGVGGELEQKVANQTTAFFLHTGFRWQCLSQSEAGGRKQGKVWMLYHYSSRVEGSYRDRSCPILAYSGSSKPGLRNLQSIY